MHVPITSPGHPPAVDAPLIYKDFSPITPDHAGSPGFGGGGGNTQTEVLVAALARSGVGCAADVMAMLEAADVFRAQLRSDPTGAVNCDALLMGYSGVYGGYLLPIRREAELAQVNARALIREIGGRRLVAGQEDVVREAALALAAATAGEP